MKKITIIMSKRVFSELRTHMLCKCMVEEAYGLPDAFIVKLIKAIENGSDEVTFKIKKK